MQEYGIRQYWTLLTRYIEQVQEGLEIAAKILHEKEPPDLVHVVAGAGTGGGSAAAFFLVRGAFGHSILAPIVLNQGYTVACVKPQAKPLGIAVSCSGETEEILSQFQEMVSMNIPIVVIAGGGTLARLAEQKGIPVIRVKLEAPPRFLIGYLFGALCGILQWAKLIPLDELNALGTLHCVFNDWELHYAQAECIANSLINRLPVIYGVADWGIAVVDRWRRQLAENAKTLSIANVIPAMHHDEIVGWERATILSSLGTVIILSSHLDPPPTQLRVKITRSILSKLLPVVDITFPYDHPLLNVWAGVLLADMTSLRLAELYRIDPLKTTILDYIKTELTKR